MRLKLFGFSMVLMLSAYSSISRADLGCLTEEQEAERQQVYRSCLGSEMQTLLSQIQSNCATKTNVDEMTACRSNVRSDQVLEIAKANCRQKAKLDQACGAGVKKEFLTLKTPAKPPAGVPQHPKAAVETGTKAHTKTGSPTNGAAARSATPVKSTGSAKSSGATPTASSHSGTKSNSTASKSGGSGTAAGQHAEARSKMNQTTPQDSGMAQGEADADLAWCSQLQATASKCCGNPMSCADQMSDNDRASLNQVRGLLAGQGPQELGLTEYCRQMDLLSTSGSNVNAGLSSVCAVQQSSCRNTCQGLVAKYQALLNNCDGCESEYIYANALNRLNAGQSACRNLQSKADLLAVNGIGMADPAAYSQYCQSVASSGPQNGMPGSGTTDGFGIPGSPPTNTNDPYGCTTNPNSLACMNCQLNPNSPYCRGLAATEQRGQAGFEPTIEAKGSAGFNVASGPSVSTAFEGIRYGDAAAALAASRQVKTIPNNSGGGVPGNGDSGSQAQLGGRAVGAAQAVARGANGSVADIDQGFRSGSGYSYPSGSTADRGLAGAGLGTFQTASVAREDDGGYFGLDLKQFLPGGSRDPGRRVLGGAIRSQIHSKEEDIWRRISIKIVEKCKLGLLFQCR